MSGLVGQRVVEGTLLIRADASIAMGTGHVMRCLALAQAWQDAGGRAVFAMAEATSAVEQRLRSEGFEVARVAVRVATGADAEETSALARKEGASWVVVDGYAFGAEYQSLLKSYGLKLLFTDDNGHAGHYSADLVLNQNVYASEGLYRSRESSTNVLLGPRYALLRREFSAWRGWKREIPVIARKILLTMGGSDPDNITERVLQVILAKRELEATVVAGGSNPQLRELRKVVEQHTGTVHLVENATNMPELIASADIAVAGAGTTTLEICFLGLPALLIVLADNQRATAEELDRRGVAINLGEGAQADLSMLAEHLATLLGSSERRKAMSETGMKLVDGLGAERVAARLNDNREGQNE
jgi:UDP-2,4-diacetamido-2,4,6-trideoxy-beta-L-altropyranose hydrolase